MTIRKYGDRVEVKMEGNDLCVYQDGKLVEKFNEMSDDYAFTNAASFARNLEWKLKQENKNVQE